MDQQQQNTMQAVAIDRFGGLEVLELRTLPVPALGEDEILIRVESAGVGVWDPMEREGKMPHQEHNFPYVLGSDGAGTIVAVGERVIRFKEGDRVYAYGYLNPKGGFYAEYTVVQAEKAAPVPDRLALDQAGALAGDGITAMVTASSEHLDEDLAGVREGGRIAYPNGVSPEPQARPGMRVTSYNGEFSPEAMAHLNELIAAGPFEVHLARTFALTQAAEAHRALADHYLGKLALRLN